MYNYEFETVKTSFDGWGGMSGSVYGLGEYREIILSRAQDGWRYVGYIPATQRGTGHVEEFDLIFEKEV